MTLARALATVAGLTGLSRIAGFARDILTASILGSGPIADAFFVALKLPNFFRRVTAEGAFSVSFVPVYTEVLNKSGQKQADHFASNTLTFMAIILAAFSLLALIFMPVIVALIAPGFETEGLRHDSAVYFSRITFLYLLLMSLTALLGGVLNAHGRYGPMAFAPVLFNLTLISALLLSDLFQTPGHALAWGVLASGFLQLAWMIVCAIRAGQKITIIRPRMTNNIKTVLKLMGPGVLGAGVMHINLFADMIIASLLEEGAISYLYYADRLNQLPLGMVGIAMGTALLPMLSKAIAKDDTAEAQKLYNRALEYSFLLALPAATGLFVLAWPIVVTLFRHGAFDWTAAQMSASVLMGYCIGLPAFVAVKVLSTSYWARQDTITPVKISVVSTFFNITLSLILVFWADLDVIGIALATGLSGWLQVALFMAFLRGRKETELDARFIKALGSIALSCLIMALVLSGLYWLLSAPYEVGAQASTVKKIGVLIAFVCAGSAVYFLTLQSLGAITIRDFKKLFKGKEA